MYYGTSAPSSTDTSRAFHAGDIIINKATSTDGPLGWRCTASGSPGTWQAIGTPGVFVMNISVTAGAAAADYDAQLQRCQYAGVLRAFYERHQTAGVDGSPVTLMLKKVTDATAKGSGTDMLSAGVNLKATADTQQSGSLHATLANYTVAAGNWVGLVASGTLTSVDGVSAQAEFLML